MTGNRLAPSRLQTVISLTLRSGVLLAGSIGVCGGSLFLIGHGTEHVNFGSFAGTDSPFTSAAKVITALHSEDSAIRDLAVVQIGIFALLLTPIVRVALSVVGFALERDHTYVAITSVVLLTLLVSVLLH